MLTMSFLLGFSTSLVILILNQLVESVQAFFGRRSGAARELEPAGLQRSGRATETGSVSHAATIVSDTDSQLVIGTGPSKSKTGDRRHGVQKPRVA